MILCQHLIVLHCSMSGNAWVLLISYSTLQWRHNGHDGVLNHQPHNCLLNHLFRRRSKKTSKLRVTGLCAGNSPGTGEFPAQRASNAENASIWWRHHYIPCEKPFCTMITVIKCPADTPLTVEVVILAKVQATSGMIFLWDLLLWNTLERNWPQDSIGAKQLFFSILSFIKEFNIYGIGYVRMLLTYTWIWYSFSSSNNVQNGFNG